MGYRSTVVIAVHKKSYFKNLLIHNKPEILEDIHDLEEDFMETEDTLYWKFEEYKWYSTDPLIDECMSFFGELDAEEYAISILGEDGDYKEVGSPYDFDLNHYAVIETPFGNLP